MNVTKCYIEACIQITDHAEKLKVIVYDVLQITVRTRVVLCYLTEFANAILKDDQNTENIICITKCLGIYQTFIGIDKNQIQINQLDRDHLARKKVTAKSWLNISRSLKL